MGKTKIVCTIGPASRCEDVVEQLAREGMNIARVNCSHGTTEEIRAIIKSLKKLRVEKQLDYEIMLDTKGPDIRIGKIKNGQVELVTGQEFILSTKDCEGGITCVTVPYPDNFAEKLKRGQVILVDDARLKLVVVEVKGANVITNVEIGGTLKRRKSLYVPGVDFEMPFLSEVDKEDITMGVEESVDMIAASFVSSAKDVNELRDFCVMVRANVCRYKMGTNDDVRIISKIENNLSITNLDEIIDASYGVMVARGDLGVAFPLEMIPPLQKMIIRRTKESGKFVIVATEMMESMTYSPRPTRAEVSDVANAVWDSACAVMLSGETARGHWPIECVKVMKSIVATAEKYFVKNPSVK